MYRYLLVIVTLLYDFGSSAKTDCGSFGWQLISSSTSMLWWEAELLCQRIFVDGTIPSISPHEWQRDFNYAASLCDGIDCWIRNVDKCGYMDKTGNFIETLCDSPSILKTAVLCTSSADPCDLLEEDISSLSDPNSNVRLAMIFDYQFIDLNNKASNANDAYNSDENGSDSSDSSEDKDDGLYPEIIWFGTERHLGLHWVPYDNRRSLYGSDDLLDLTLAIDETQPAVKNVSGELIPIGGSLYDVVRGAGDWFDTTTCTNDVNLQLIDVAGDIGHDSVTGNPPTVENQVADITFDGFVDRGLNRNTLGRAYIWAFTDEDGNATDINNDGHLDVSFAHLRLNGKYWFFEWSIDSSTPYDIYSVSLHEIGHVLGLGHWGKVVVWRDANGEFVDVTVTPETVMSPFYLGKEDGLYASDKQAFCSLWSSYGDSDSDSESSSESSSDSSSD